MPELLLPALGGLVDFGPAIGVLPDIGAASLGLDAAIPAAAAGAAAVPAALSDIAPGVVDAASATSLGTDISGIGGLAGAAGGLPADVTAGAFGGAAGSLADVPLGVASSFDAATAAGLPAATAADIGATFPAASAADFGAAAAGLPATAADASFATAAPGFGTAAGGLPAAADPFASAFSGTLGTTDPFAGTSFADTSGPFGQSAANAAGAGGQSPLSLSQLGPQNLVTQFEQTGLPTTVPSVDAGQFNIFNPSEFGGPDAGIPNPATTGLSNFSLTPTEQALNIPGFNQFENVVPEITTQQEAGVLGSNLTPDLQGSFPEVAQNVPQLPDAENFQSFADRFQNVVPPTSAPVTPTTVPGTTDPLASLETGRGVGGGWSSGAFDPATVTSDVPITPSETSPLDAANPMNAAPPLNITPSGLPAATPNILGTFTNALTANPLMGASLGLGALGLGAAVYRNLQALPEQKQLEALAAQLASNVSANQATANALISPLLTGNLPPNLASQVVHAQQDAITQIKSRYASMGQSGSTAEINDIAASIQNSAVVSGELEQQLATQGIALTQAATQGLNVESTIFQALMDAQINANDALAQSIAAFAGQSALASAVASRKVA